MTLVYRIIAPHLKSHSLLKSKFKKILVENTTIIAHENDKRQVEIPEALYKQIPDALHTKKPIIDRINFENSYDALKCL